MTENQVLAVLDLIDKRMHRSFPEAAPKQYPHLIPAYEAEETTWRDHVLWMTQNTRDLIQNKRIEKAMRWLGFIQGILWAQKVYTIEDMKNHNTRVTK